jgi:hypothetical protein
MKKICTVLLLVGVVLCGSAMATPIVVGTGANDATIFVQWSDGYEAEFLVNFDFNFVGNENSAPTGYDLLQVLDSSLYNFSITWQYGTYIDGLTFVDAQNVTHSNSGYIPDEGWWHYYTNISGTTLSSVGCADRTIADGDVDRWVYPVPEPVTVALMGLGSLIALRRKA